MAAFAAPVSLGSSSARVLPWTSRSVDIRAPPSAAAPRVTMVAPATKAAADAYMARTARAQYKRAAAAAGTYTVQCAEASVHGAAYNAAVRARSAAFRARQASPSARYADLYATRRAAIVGAHGCHTEEVQLVANPIAAASVVIGKAEALRACNRYVPAGGQGVVDKYMADSVTRQYKQMSVEGGVYGTSCIDGSTFGEAEDARVQALSVQFKANHFSESAKTQARYNSSLRAIALSRGCDYEEKQYSEYPSMAASMRWGTGAYAASAAGAAAGISGGGGSKPQPLAVRLSGPNAKALWPSSLIRPAVKRTVSPWLQPAGPKQYRGMSPAAVAYGVAAQTGAFSGGLSDSWSPGWQPKSVTASK